MDRYDYREAVISDIRDYINDNDIDIDSVDYDSLYDDLWCEDSVSGNASGSYWFSSWKAEEALCHNLDLLSDAMREFGGDPSDWFDRGAEFCDVSIRCYLLGECLSEVLNG